MTQQHDQNLTLFERARHVIPGGVNSPVRAFKAVGGTPRFIKRAQGAYFWDANDQKYIDYIGSWGPMILGHGHPAVVEAVQKAVLDGFSFGAPTEREVELAEAILLPNKTLAQGFVANHFELKDGTEIDGFVVREAADAVTIRTITAIEQTIPISHIALREKQQRSLMPEGLAAGLTVRELASVLDYLEQLSRGSK